MKPYLQNESHAYRVAVVGATGRVGRVLLDILEKRSFPISKLRLIASPKSAGSPLRWQDKDIEIESLDQLQRWDSDLVFFCAGSEVSKRAVHSALQEGAWVIDNASCFRMQTDVPLVIPEINWPMSSAHRLIANPNCTTAQLVMALKPLNEAFGLKSVRVSSYQAVSGQGQKGEDCFKQEVADWIEGKARPRSTLQSRGVIFPHPIAFNCIPQIDRFAEEAYTGEEWKVMQETRKILGLKQLQISATCVRVPVFNGHSISVQVETEREIPSLDEVRKRWREFPGLEVIDEPGRNDYPLAGTASGRDEVFVGRLRYDLACTQRSCGLLFWVVADNLRKGAALNAVQIAERLIEP